MLSDGSLKLVSTVNMAAPLANNCGASIAVSADGKYLASTEIQIYSIASDGTLTPVLPQLFKFMSAGSTAVVLDVTWDSSSAYLIASVYTGCNPCSEQGMAVLQFSGNGLTETSPPSGEPPVAQLWRLGSFFYGANAPGIVGYALQNGLLTPLPGLPYAFPFPGFMVIY